MLVAALPLNDEVKQLEAYQGNLEDLTVVSRFLKSLVSRPRAVVQVRILEMLGSLREKVAGLMHDLAIWAKSCVQLTRSSSLHTIMAIMLRAGNFLNFGTARGAAVGIRISTCLKASQIRSIGNPHCKTLLHYVARVAKGKRIGAGVLASELKDVPKAGKTSLSGGVLALQQIKDGLGKLKRELEARRVDGGEAKSDAEKAVQQLLDDSKSAAKAWSAQDAFAVLDNNGDDRVSVMEVIKFNRELGFRVRCEVSSFNGLFQAVDGVVDLNTFQRAFVEDKLPEELISALHLGSLAKIMSTERQLAVGLARLEGKPGHEPLDLDELLVLLQSTTESLTTDRACVESSVASLLKSFGEEVKGNVCDVGQDWISQVGSFVTAFEKASNENDQHDELQRKRTRIEEAKKLRDEELRARRGKRNAMAKASGSAQGGGQRGESPSRDGESGRKTSVSFKREGDQPTGEPDRADTSGSPVALALQRRGTGANPRGSTRPSGVPSGGGGVLDDLMHRVQNGQIFYESSAINRAKVNAG